MSTYTTKRHLLLAFQNWLEPTTAGQIDNKSCSGLCNFVDFHMFETTYGSNARNLEVEAVCDYLKDMLYTEFGDPSYPFGIKEYEQRLLEKSFPKSLPRIQFVTETIDQLTKDIAALEAM